MTLNVPRRTTGRLQRAAADLQASDLRADRCWPASRGAR
jgi:hypothetical protein